MSRSLRELCMQATVPLPPELEGPTNSDHLLSLSEAAKNNSSSGTSQLSGDVARSGADGDAGAAAALGKSPLADLNRSSSTGAKQDNSSGDSSGGTARAAAAAVAETDAADAAAAEAGHAVGAAGLSALPAAAAVQPALAAPAAGPAAADGAPQEGQREQAPTAIPVVIAIAPPIAAGVEAGNPKAIASAATAAATAVLAQVPGVSLLGCCSSAAARLDGPRGEGVANQPPLAARKLAMQVHSSIGI